MRRKKLSYTKMPWNKAGVSLHSNCPNNKQFHQFCCCNKSKILTSRIVANNLTVVLGVVFKFLTTSNFLIQLERWIELETIFDANRIDRYILFFHYFFKYTQSKQTSVVLSKSINSFWEVWWFVLDCTNKQGKKHINSIEKKIK